MDGWTQEAAAAAAGMSVRTARRWELGPLPSQGGRGRAWRTRQDPFEGVWERDVVPLLEADEARALQATTILDELVQRHPDGGFGPGQLRTLQRRVRDWRALRGPDRPVIFPQEHPPGREAAIDFTRGTELEVRIAGVVFEHLWFTFRLSFSTWTWIDLAFGETFEALCAGTQGALWALGGAPEVYRSDNLSAATHELRKTGGRALNRRFQDVLDHYGMSSTRIRPGESHENGGAEKGNHRVKTSIAQALIVRGDRDFPSVETYVAFAREAVDRRLNDPIADRLELERQHLRPLPPAPIPSYTVHRPKVRAWSTVRVGGRMYSVPSRLIGHTVEVHQHPDHLEVFYRGHLVEAFPRLRGDDTARIDYRHVIWSLVRKPGAFARYRYREALFPTLTFRRAYDALVDHRGERADVDYVRILHLAASTLETRVEQALELLLEAHEPFDYAAVKALAQPEPIDVPHVVIPEPDLTAYDGLLQGGAS